MKFAIIFALSIFWISPSHAMEEYGLSENKPSTNFTSKPKQIAVSKPALPKDSLKSVMWSYMANDFILPQSLKTAKTPPKIVMDDRVRVLAPKVAEDQFNVPIKVDARALGEDKLQIRKIIILADLNPLPKVLIYRPIEAEPVISLRIKVEQATPVRAAVLTSDNVWHVGGTYIDASGGGCSAPAMAHGQDDWVSRLAEVKARIWRRLGQKSAKLRLKVRHPMDTGLADGIPAFYLEKLHIKSEDGKALGELEIFEPVSENPTLTLMPKIPNGAQSIHVEGRDTDGNELNVKVPAHLRSSRLELRDNNIYQAGLTKIK